MRVDTLLGRLIPNGTNLGLLKPKFTETDLKKSQICPIWAISTQFGLRSDIPEQKPGTEGKQTSSEQRSKSRDEWRTLVIERMTSHPVDDINVR